MKTYIIWNLKEKAFLIVDPDGYEKVNWTHEINRATEFSKSQAKKIAINNREDLPVPSPYCHEF